MWLRQTLCFCMLDGQWQITHQHESVPFYMDGGYKAASISNLRVAVSNLHA